MLLIIGQVGIFIKQRHAEGGGVSIPLAKLRVLDTPLLVSTSLGKFLHPPDTPHKYRQEGVKVKKSHTSL